MSRSDRGGRDRGFWERPAANALVFHEPLSLGPPVLRGEPEGGVGSRVRRGNLGKGAYAYSLPFCSVDEAGASTRFNAPKLPNRRTGRLTAGARCAPLRKMKDAPAGRLYKNGPPPLAGILPMWHIFIQILEIMDNYAQTAAQITENGVSLKQQKYKRTAAVGTRK